MDARSTVPTSLSVSLDLWRNHPESLPKARSSAIRELEGPEADPARYSDPDSENFGRMVERVRQRLALTTLRYQRLEDLVAAIGLPKRKLCTYCWDGAECADVQEPLF